MKNKPFFVAFLLLIAVSCLAQPTQTKSVYQNGKVPIWINLGTGLNFINSYDLGASPQIYYGFGVNLKTGVTVEWKRYHIQTEMRGLGNMMFNNSDVQSSGYGGDIRLEFLYHGLDFGDGNWHLWYGGGMQAYFDFKIRSQLMNASLGYSSFVNMVGTCMVQYDFRPIFNGRHHLFSVYGKLSLPLFGSVTRPDFAYLGNPTSDPSNAMSMLNYFNSFFMAFPGAITDFGFVINLPNSNKIGFSYCWDYYTTRHNGAYRFDHAAHTFNTTFMFNLN